MQDTGNRQMAAPTGQPTWAAIVAILGTQVQKRFK
jgi:hypothetical protein